ncbi:MAG: hypothetical protein AB2A00_19260 [Myxococcota bacterium]
MASHPAAPLPTTPTLPPSDAPAPPLEENAAPRAVAFGLALVTCATMLAEVAYTRILSVSLWYHYAFMAISLALFGMAFGAVIVYVRPSWFPQERLGRSLTLLALGFALTMVVGFAVHLQLPVGPPAGVKGLGLISVIFLLLSVPFMASGVLVALALTRFPRAVGTLYAFDLVGAAVACLVFWAFIPALGGPAVIVLAGALAAGAAVCFSLRQESAALRRTATVTTLVLLALAMLNPQLKLLRMRHIKQQQGAPVEAVLEWWNVHSVVTAVPYRFSQELVWGLSSKRRQELAKQPHPGFQIDVRIDGSADTVITQYSGNPAEIAHLMEDMTFTGYALRPRSDILVIGAGGGRDVLAGLLVEASSITALEINETILEMLNGAFGDFSGHLDRNPRVKFVHDEARSWLESSDRKFDIIQMSLIDTWAATSAGAFVLAENSLYTLQAWRTFLRHLDENGVLSVTRWWWGSPPPEILRSLSLAYSALRAQGVMSPRAHVILVSNAEPDGAGQLHGLGTMLISLQPFSDDDIATVERFCQERGLTVALSPKAATIPELAQMLDPAAHDALVAGSSHDLSASTDDRPFFFNTRRFSDVMREGGGGHAAESMVLLLVLFVMVSAMCVLGLLVPLWLHERGRRRQHAVALPRGRLVGHGIYFAAIGLGFTLVEMGQMQRLTLFLGHPAYSLTTVLFCMLLATGLGSFLTGRLVVGRAPRVMVSALVMTLGVTTVMALVLPEILGALGAAPLSTRLVVAGGAVALTGVPMGVAFPLGLSLAERDVPPATPWLWATNGALSVVGSVLAVIMSIAHGITVTCAVGAACYLVAVLALLRHVRPAPTS